MEGVLSTTNVSDNLMKVSLTRGLQTLDFWAIWVNFVNVAFV